MKTIGTGTLLFGTVLKSIREEKMEFLEFIFSSFWHFIGTFLILIIIINGLVEAMNTIRGTNKHED